MARSRAVPGGDVSVDVNAALEAMSADDLRAVIRDLIPWLDNATHARLMNQLVDRAARSATGWVPEAPDERRISEIETFAAAAKRVGHADPSDVDDYLRQGTSAFLAKNYPAALRIFRALLIPLANVDIDLGQHEQLDEVLGVDVSTCAAEFVVSMYMTASPDSRGKTVLSAIDEMEGVGYFFEPLRELEDVAVESLPDFDDFLVQWRVLIERRVRKAPASKWSRREDRWLREVVARQRGPEGLAEIARESRKADDLRAWCEALAEAGDWQAARAAFDEAADLVKDKAYARGEFLDGAALATQELGGEDLDDRVERAWREAPTMLRLRRWLGAASTADALRERAASAVDACPRKATRQRALLHILLGEHASAAKLLARARGLGWSGAEHPGHLVFPVFVWLLGGSDAPIEFPRDYEDLDSLLDDGRPRLRAPDIESLLALAEVPAPSDAETRAAMLEAMRAAVEKRVEGVTANKRRRHYGHAASFAVTCTRVDSSPEGEAWLKRLEEKYRRYPALQRAFKAAR